MSHITDARFEALRAQLPSEPPTTNDLLFAWTLTQGGSGGTLNDRIYNMLIAQGATPGHVNDMWAQVLTAQGFTGQLNDQLKAFWDAGGTFGPDIDHYLLEDIITDSYLLEDGQSDLYLITGSPFTVKSVASMSLLSNQQNPETVGGLTRRDWWWKQDGTRTWVWRSDGSFRQYDVSPAWTMAPGIWTLSSTVNIATTNARTFQWNPDGTKILTCVRFGGVHRLESYDQSATPFDSTVLGTQAVSATFAINNAEMVWRPDGEVVFITNVSTGVIEAFAVSTAFDVTTFSTTVIDSFDASVDTTIRRATFEFSYDGSKLYSVDSDGAGAEFLCEWTLSTPYIISTAGNFVKGVDIELPPGDSMITPIGLFVRHDTGFIYLMRDVQGTPVFTSQRAKVFG